MQWGKCGCDDSYWGPVSNNFPPSHTNSPSSCPQRFQGSQNGALQHPLLSLWLSLPIQARRSQNKQITIRHGSRMLVVWPHILHLIHYFPWCPIPVMPLLCPPSYLQFSGSPNVFWGCLHAKSLQLCLTLCNPMDCNRPGSSVHGIHQARIVEWIAMPSSRGSSQPRDQTRLLCLLYCRQILYHWAFREAELRHILRIKIISQNYSLGTAAEPRYGL